MPFKEELQKQNILTHKNNLVNVICVIASANLGRYKMNLNVSSNVFFS